jgi:hypothetical protein
MCRGSFALAFTVGLLALCAGAQTTCSVGRILLSTLASQTYTIGTTSYTLHYCSPGQPLFSDQNTCATAGYVLVHESGVCQASYSTILQGLTQYTSAAGTGVYFNVTSDGTTANEVAAVTVVCDTSRTTPTLDLVSNVTVGTRRTLSLTITSRSGCSMSSLFCNDDPNNQVLCAETTQSCVNNICFEKSFGRLTTIASGSATSSAFNGQFSVADRRGTPLANLTRNDFVVSLNGVDTDGLVFNNEVPLAIATAPQAVPAITTLLLDQSASVTATSQSLLQEAARTYVLTVAGSNKNHFVAVIAFDGAAEPVVVLQHTNNTAAIINAINNSLPPAAQRDPLSTNLYGAVIFGVRAANAMRYSFGPANSSVISSMIVFTDGFDTAGRTDRAAAIVEANRFSATVSIISIGVRETSDTAFLTDIATSGLTSFPSSGGLATSFLEVAIQVANAANSVYSAALCVPLRSSTVTIAVRLNTTRGYATDLLAEFTVNASKFTGGCTQAIVNTLATTAGSANTTVGGDSTVPETLTYGTTKARTLTPSAALFLKLNAQSTTSIVTVTPATLMVLYLESSRCILSPYCNDGNFTGSFTPKTATAYTLMVQNGADSSTAVTVFFGPASGTTPSPGSTATTTTSTSTSTTPSPTSVTSTSTLTLLYNVSEAGSGDVDNAAAYVFLGFGIIVVALSIGWVALAWLTNALVVPKNAVSRRPLDHSYTVQPRYSGDSGVYARTPSVGAHSPHMMMQEQPSGLAHTLMMSGTPGAWAGAGAATVLTNPSPYRKAVFGHSLSTAPRRDFYDPSSRWSPQRDLDNL